MVRTKNASQLARSKPITSGVNEGPKKKTVNKGKKKVKPDPVFEEDDLDDSEDAGSDESGGEESSSDDGESEDVDYDEEEDVQEGEASEEEPEPNKDGYHDLLIKLLREKVETGKRKRGTGAVKQTAKRAKQKVDKTKGEEVKEKGVVVKTQSRNTQKAPNMHGVKAFASAVKKFDDSRKKLVTEMGFGGLLSIPLTFLPRKFVYWLLTRVMGDGSITFGDEYVLPLSPLQVEHVLGIPMGSKALPSRIPEDKQAEYNRILQKFGKKDSISLAAALGALIRTDEEGKVLPLSDDEKADFKIAFMISALGYVLCATANTSYLGVKLVPTLLVYDETEEYDWCTFVFNWMVVAARSFQKKFACKGYVAGSGGCILFVLIFYLDHLSRVPMAWGVRPRLAAWSEDKINEAVVDDKKDTGDYGKLPSLNIAYGEDHPLTPREVPKKMVDSVKVQQITQQIDVENITQQVFDRITPQLMSVMESKLGDVMKSMHELMSQCVGIANSQRVIRGKPMERAKPMEEQVVLHEKLPGEKDDAVNGGDQDLASCLLEKEQLEQVGEGGGGSPLSSNELDNEKVVDILVGTDQAQDKVHEGAFSNAGVDVVWDTDVLDVEAIAVAVGAQAVDDCEKKEFEFEMDDIGGWSSELEDEDHGLVAGGEVVLGLVGTRGTTVLVDRSDETDQSSSDGEEEHKENSREGTADKRVIKPTAAACSSMYTKASDTRRHTTFETRMLQYVRRWRELNDPLCPGLVLIACDNMEANQRECYTVVHPRSRVDNQYVRMASVLYTKLWATTEFLNRSKRILLDPSFADRLLLKEEGKEEHVARKYGKVLLSYNLNEIKTVFIPVLIVPKTSPDDAHWFCLALDLKGRKLWMIDSLYPDPFQQHAAQVDALLSGIDVLFKLSDPSWKMGLLSGWKRSAIEVMGPSDPSYCGVFMLAAIKYCARRFTSRFSAGKITSARANLFLDDAQCEANELNDKLEGIIPSVRKTERKH